MLKLINCKLSAPQFALISFTYHLLVALYFDRERRDEIQITPLGSWNKCCHHIICILMGHYILLSSQIVTRAFTETQKYQ